MRSLNKNVYIFSVVHSPFLTIHTVYGVSFVCALKESANCLPVSICSCKKTPFAKTSRRRVSWKNASAPARWMGVLFSRLSNTTTLAPCLIRLSTVDVCPSVAARCNGVRPATHKHNMWTICIQPSRNPATFFVLCVRVHDDTEQRVHSLEVAFVRLNQDTNSIKTF